MHCGSELDLLVLQFRIDSLENSAQICAFFGSVSRDFDSLVCLFLGWPLEAVFCCFLGCSVMIFQKLRAECLMKVVREETHAEENYFCLFDA